MAADDDTIRTTCHEYTARFTAGDRDGWLDLFADGAWIEDPVGSPRHEGKEAIGAFWDQSRELAADIELRMVDAIPIAGEAAFFMEIRPLLGDTRMSMPGIDVMTFDDDGRITSMRAFFDASRMAPAED